MCGKPYKTNGKPASLSFQEKNEPRNLTVIRDIAKTIGKTTIPARWDSTAGEDTDAETGGTRRTRNGTMRKPLVKQAFPRAGAGGTLRSMLVPIARLRKSYGYCKSLENH